MMIEADSKTARAGAGWLFYDRRCPLCRRFSRWLRPALLRREFYMEPLQSGWVQSLLDLEPAEALSSLRLLLPDRTVLTGTEAGLYLARRIWWARPMTMVARIPGVLAALHRMHERVGHHRPPGGRP